jgi:putative hydrolase of the HAD superfamily
MKYEAVIFDLFGTLVDIFSYTEYRATLEEMAVALKIPPTDFMDIWFNTVHERALGLFPTITAHIGDICRRLGVHVESADMEKAAQIKLLHTLKALRPRHEALETLNTLHSLGLKLGLLSDCSVEIPHIWSDTPFDRYIDAAVFSCDVTMKKPDPRVYHLICNRLHVDAETCLYVGDGGSYELTGALGVGMDAVCIRVPYEDIEDAHRVEAEDWRGPIISTLKEVISLVTS